MSLEFHILVKLSLSSREYKTITKTINILSKIRNEVVTHNTIKEFKCLEIFCNNDQSIFFWGGGGGG